MSSIEDLQYLELHWSHSKKSPLVSAAVRRWGLRRSESGV